MIIKKELFLNFLISIIPITYITGNLLLNLNILLIILFSFIFFGSKIFDEKITFIDKLLIIFFFYIATNGLINNYFNYDSNTVQIKSLTYLRFLFLYFVLRFLINRNLINFKYIFFSYGISCLFVALDIIIQYIFKQDIFGYTALENQRVLSGPFGDEYIAGSFIQRFYIFALYFIILFGNYKKTISVKILVHFFIAVFFMAALLAGNRIPLILFILITILFFLLEKSFRKQFLIIFVILFSLITTSLLLNKNVKTHYLGLFKHGIEIKDYALARFDSKSKNHIPNTWAKEIETGILVWQQNKFFGGGVKSFYFNCTKVKNSILDDYGGTNCNSHPHNYYLQIAGELGLIGLFLSISIFFLIVFMALKTIFSTQNNYTKFLIPFFIVFIAEIFPLKTTGSFFTSANSTYLFIIISFILGLIQVRKRENYD